MFLNKIHVVYKATIRPLLSIDYQTIHRRGCGRGRGGAPVAKNGENTAATAAAALYTLCAPPAPHGHIVKPRDADDVPET